MQKTGPHKWTDNDVKALLKLQGIGKSYSEIAESLGEWCTRSAVASKLKKVRKSILGYDDSKIDIAALAEAWKDTSLSSSKIAEMFSLTPGKVRSIAIANKDLFAPRNNPKKKITKQSHPKTSIWKRRDPSLPPPQPFNPFTLDEFEISRVPHAKSLFDLSSFECKWPIGENRPYKFCACQTTPAGTYCAHHAAKSVGPGTISEQRATILPKEAA